MEVLSPSQRHRPGKRVYEKSRSEKRAKAREWRADYESGLQVSERGIPLCPGEHLKVS